MIRKVMPAMLVTFALAGALHGQTFAGPKVADAKPGEVRVIVTAALRGPLDTVLASASKAIGKPIIAEYGSARGNLKKEILDGQEFEVAILLPDVDEELLKAGKILPETHRLATVPIAFAIRGDAPGIDVSTPAAVKNALLKARSVKYAPTGAALFTVRKVLTTLAIADQIKDSSTLREAVPLAPGEYEVNIYPVSEIIPNKALRNLGPVIPALQVPSILEATVGAHATDQTTARKLIRYLQGPAINAGLKASGMTKDVRNSK